MSYDASHLLTVGHAKQVYDNLKSAIDALDYWHKSFDSTGAEHSSGLTKDHAIVDIKQGATFYIKTTACFTSNYMPYAFYSDGTNEALGATKPNTFCQYVANKNITSIGIYVQPQSSAYTFDFVVAIDGSAILNELANTEESIKNELILNANGAQSFYPFATFANGGLRTTGLYDYTQPYRVSCIEHITVDKDTTIHVKNGYRWGYIPFINGSAGSWVGWKTTDYTIPANTEFVVQISKTTEDTSTVANINEYVNAVTFATEFGNSIAVKSHQYIGEKIPSKTHSFDSKLVFSMSYSGQVAQDIEVFGNYMFVAFSTVEQIKVYSLLNNSLVATIDIGTNHGSAMQFAGVYYSESDDFPLLYVGGWNTNLINVVRITVSGNTWSASVVKTIYIPTTYGYFASPNIDMANNIMYTYALRSNAVHDTDPRIIASWDLNSLTDNGDGTYTPKLINQCDSPNVGVYQGHKFYGGKIYMAISNTESPYAPKLIAINCGDGSIATTIDVSDFVTTELEGICYKTHDGIIDWYISETQKVFKLEF